MAPELNFGIWLLGKADCLVTRFVARLGRNDTPEAWNSQNTHTRTVGIPRKGDWISCDRADQGGVGIFELVLFAEFNR